MECEKLVLTVEQARVMLGISRGLAYDLVRQGRLPVLRLGRRLMVPRAALDKMLEATGRPNFPAINELARTRAPPATPRERRSPTDLNHRRRGRA